MTSASARDSRVAWHARWVLPINTTPLHDAAVVVDGDSILWVGPSEHAEAGTHERLGNCVLMPGLVNAHAHLELTGLRGFLEGLDFRDWLRVLTHTRANVLRAQDIADAARLGVSEALRAGITTIADCSATGASLDAMRDAGIRGRVYLETFGPAVSQRADSLAALRTGVDGLRARANTLVDVGVSPHAPYTVSEPLFESVAQYAREQSLPVATHIAESASEVQFVRDGRGPFAERLRGRDIDVRATNGSPIGLLERTGLLDTQLLCIHAVHADDADIARLVASGAAMVHCPISNAKLGQGIAPIIAMRSSGVVTGLGTDSVASNDRMDLIAEARQAVLLQSLRESRPDALSATDALSMATVGGAQALGMPSLGALEAGRPADLCAFRIDAFEAVPVYDPAVTLVHVLGSGRGAALTMVAGRVLVRDGRELAFDQSVRDRVMASGARVMAGNVTST